jgi:hypothetical protein
MTGRRLPYAMPKGLRWAVFSRDGGCILASLQEGHQCKDRWNQPHAPNNFDVLSVEHIKLELGMSVPRIHDLQHCVTLCAAANINVPSKAQRELMRSYLRGLYPELVPA